MRVFCRLMIILCAALIHTVSAQQLIFPGLSGQQLLDSLVQAYKPATVLSYTAARNFMYTVLDNHQDSVACVYTGFKIYLDPNSASPIQAALAAGINNEHTWPQSLGATGNAQADLHHLFPVRADVNSDRGNLPFAEIPDPQTDRWYRLHYQQTAIPAQFIDEYSELDLNLRFEPREDHKGNAARAIFYFYTMYRAQADPTFFLVQKENLRSWNVFDPPDSAELSRTSLIAGKQEGKPNPFVLDTTLAGRAYFPATGLPGHIPAGPAPAAFTLQPNYPNPFNPQTRIVFELFRAAEVELAIFDLAGREVRTLLSGALPAGQHEAGWDSRDARGNLLPSGIYLYRLRTSASPGGGESGAQTRKMVLIR